MFFERLIYALAELVIGRDFDFKMFRRKFGAMGPSIINILQSSLEFHKRSFKGLELVSVHSFLPVSCAMG